VSIKTSSCLWVVALAALPAMGICAAQMPSEGSATALDRVGAILPLAEFRADSSSPDALSERASRIATLIAGAEVSAVAAEKASAQQRNDFPGRVEYVVESAKRIAIQFDSRRSELVAVHGAVSDDYMSTADVGVDGAHKVFEGAIKSLESAKLVQTEGLALETVRTGRVMQAELGRDREAVKRIKAYFFEVPRTVDGIEVFGSSITISVHRSGQIESIRSIGPGALRTKATLRRNVSVQSLTERARKENPGAEVSHVGLRYPWDAVRGDVALASRPRETFRVVSLTTVDGVRIHGRSHYVFYAVDDKKLPPIVWPKPNPLATGDTGK
jgi:hypothetical protein